MNEIKEIEEFLEGKLKVEDCLFFEARLLTSPLLRSNSFFLKKTLSIVRLYHRKKLKEEIEEIHNRLFSNPEKKEFQQYIHQMFKK